jgi:hypothetical protein
MEKLFFIKLLVVLSIICMILIMSSKINEQFDNLFPSPIRVNVDTNNRKDRLILKWSKSSNDIESYFIILFKNNDGPYIITQPDLDIPNNTSFKYEYLDVQMNVDYKFAVIAYNSKKLFSSIENFTKVKLTPPGLQVEYVKDVVSKITCNSDGSFTMKNSNKCTPEQDIIQAKTINETGDMSDFNTDKHEELMRNLNYSPKLFFTFN